MIKHSGRAKTSCISSRDVRGRSEFESRPPKLAYLGYEARKYTDEEFWIPHELREVGRANSALKRGGSGYALPYDGGEIQGYGGGLVDGMRAKIIAYFHYKVKKQKMVSGGDYPLVQIDDVVYHLTPSFQNH